MPFKQKLIRFTIISVLSVFPFSSLAGEPVRIGTWKTAQTIQPFFYPQAEFSYVKPVEENLRRGPDAPEFELSETGH